VVVATLAVACALVPMPSGRRVRAAGTATSGATAGPAAPSLLAGPLLLLGVAIACYVASEIGVSNWVVRFLESAPLTTATLALSLYWAGLTVGRLASSVVADRFDHLRFTIACSLGMAVLIAAAVLVPSLPLSIAGFALAGVASGPVFPMIVAIGGDRYPDRSRPSGARWPAWPSSAPRSTPRRWASCRSRSGWTIAMLGSALRPRQCRRPRRVRPPDRSHRAALGAGHARGGPA